MMEQKKYIQIPSLDLNNDNNLDSTEQQELSLISLPLLKSESSHQNDSNLNALEHMTEQQFLTLLLNTHSSSLSPLSSSTSSLDQNAFHNLIKLKIKQRLCQLKVNDDASRLESLPFVRLALYRSPAILLTLSIEMIVAIVISRY